MSSWSKCGAIILGISAVTTFLHVVPACCISELLYQCSDRPKHVVLDLDDLNNYNPTYGICQEGSCNCLPGDKHRITKAYLYDMNGMVYNLSILNDRHHFNVVLPKQNESLPGTHTYRVGYDYECPYVNLHLPCFGGKSKEMKLTVKIVDYKLGIGGTTSNLPADTNREEKKITYNEKFGNNVILVCSSSLTSVNDSALDVPVEFVFNNPSGPNYIKSVECNNINTESAAANTNWIIGHQTFPPYDCALTIVDFGPEDIGEYRCAGLLPRDDSLYEKDWSKTYVYLSSIDSPKKNSNLYYISFVAVVIILIVMVALFAIRVYRKRRGQPPVPAYLRHAPSAASLLSHHSLHQNYGTANSLNGLIPSIATSENEGEIETNVLNPSVEVSLREPSGASGALSAPLSKEGTHISTLSEGTEGRQYYEQYTDIQHPNGRRTPEDSEAPLNENYKCPHCGKTYHDDQRLFYRRHMQELQQRCPNYSADQETDVNNTNKKEGSNPDSVAKKFSERLSNEEDPISSRSRGSTMSEIREGKGYYKDHVEMQIPEDGPTPEESEFPLDGNFKCNFCGKTYHKDQRLYFKRHMEELMQRCPKYNSLEASNGSSSQEQPLSEPAGQEQ